MTSVVYSQFLVRPLEPEMALNCVVCMRDEGDDQNYPSWPSTAH